MIHYETIYIASPLTTDQKITEINDKLSDIVKKHKGTVKQFDDWGTRRLGYKIRKHQQGHYVRVDYEAAPGVVPELERSLQLRDEVLKQMTIKIEEEK